MGSLVGLTNTSEKMSVSSWTGYNMMTGDNVSVKKDTFGKLPIINEPATNLSTIYEVLNNMLKTKKPLNIDEIVYVFDQALYAKAAELIWKQEDKYKQVVLRIAYSTPYST